MALGKGWPPQLRGRKGGALKRGPGSLVGATRQASQHAHRRGADGPEATSETRGLSGPAPALQAMHVSASSALPAIALGPAKAQPAGVRMRAGRTRLSASTIALQLNGPSATRIFAHDKQLHK